MMRYRFFVAVAIFCVVLPTRTTSGFTPIANAVAVANGATKNKDNPTKSNPATNVLEPKDVVTKVAVAGATGRTGRVVVEELQSRGVTEVVALVRDVAAAEEVFSGAPDTLKITKCDLSNERQLQQVLQGVDAMIWCATGFSNKPDANPLEKAKGLFDLALKRTIDVIALPNMARQIKKTSDAKADPATSSLPKVVMLSSAGVTRTIWDDQKKALMPGAADIPIVRLNPFGALDIKRESEDKLRETGVNYAIVRPCGLNDKHPAGSRPLFSQGDVAVGRINRKDVAKLLVDCLAAPEASGKTFEVIGVAGYDPAVSIRGALSNLRSDTDEPLPLEAVLSTYTTLQQLLPGETQDAAALAMGQTYEQLDKNEKGRLGPRGKENALGAAPKPSS